MHVIDWRIDFLSIGLNHKKFAISVFFDIAEVSYSQLPGDLNFKVITRLRFRSIDCWIIQINWCPTTSFTSVTRFDACSCRVAAVSAIRIDWSIYWSINQIDWRTIDCWFFWIDWLPTSKLHFCHLIWNWLLSSCHCYRWLHRLINWSDRLNNRLLHYSNQLVSYQQALFLSPGLTSAVSLCRCCHWLH